MSAEPSIPLNAERVPDIGQGWLEHLGGHFQRSYFQQLKAFLVEERAQHAVYPKGKDMLRALPETPLEQVRVVLLGQDPYHGPGQAHGLCFSVPEGVPIPPSLQNMFIELERDLGLPRPRSGDLTSWARQGVLLLNATLSVRAHSAGSHQNKGWETFTDAAISAVNTARTGVVFLLWGRYAQNKEVLIDADRHYVLKAPHPSPLSAHKGFIGCGHFSATNAILHGQGQAPIDWRLP